MVLKIDSVVYHEHIYDKVVGKHGIDPEDVELALLNDDPKPFFERKGERYIGYCQVPDSGQYLFVVFALQGKDTARIITASGMTDKERNSYKKNAGI